MDRIEIKTTENQLRQEFIQGYGYPPRIADALVRTVTDHIRANYGDLQQGGQVIYLAVAKEEPAGKPLKECQLVTVKLTLSAKGDRKILKEEGLITLRRRKIVRMCHEALDQRVIDPGGLGRAVDHLCENGEVRYCCIEKRGDNCPHSWVLP